MYRVELYARVRRACHVEGMSTREASRVFGVDRKTVRKMLSFSVPPGYRRSAPPRRPKLGPFTGIIDRILEDDRTSHRKQRHTAKRIFDRLRDEYGFTGGYTIVKDLSLPFIPSAAKNLGNLPVPSIYSIVPPNDGSALRHGHHFEPVDFVIDHGRGHHDAYSAGSCQRTYARACGCRQRTRCHREELIESERGWSGREAFVTMMQTADLGQGNDRSRPGRLNGSSIRCVLAERQVGP